MGRKTKKRATARLDPLTPKQRRFVMEYAVDLHPANAALRAGYSQKSARQIAHRLLQDELIRGEAEKARERYNETCRKDHAAVQDRVEQILAIALGEKSVKDPMTGKEVRRVDLNSANKAVELLAKLNGLLSNIEAPSAGPTEQTVVYYPSNGREPKNAEAPEGRPKLKAVK